MSPKLDIVRSVSEGKCVSQVPVDASFETVFRSASLVIACKACLFSVWPFAVFRHDQFAPVLSCQSEFQTLSTDSVLQPLSLHWWKRLLNGLAKNSTVRKLTLAVANNQHEQSFFFKHFWKVRKEVIASVPS